jgi:hypothetical protein
MEDVVAHNARVNWPKAIIASFAAGAVVWLLSHGTPWFTSGMVSPSLMGRDLNSLGNLGVNSGFAIVLGHGALSLCYGLIISALVAHLRGLWAVALGATVGLILYVFNFAAFHLLENLSWSSSELPVIFTHLVFGAVVAGIYKGWAARGRLPMQNPS